MKKTVIFWLKVAGCAILAHVMLITLSIAEVFMYSITFNPGQDQKVYEAHAQVSAPYVSILFGIPVFWLIARLLYSKNNDRKNAVLCGLPAIYIVLDIAMLIPYKVDWIEHLWIFVLSFGTKFLGAYAGIRFYKKRSDHEITAL
jgi:hypothetical protein